MNCKLSLHGPLPIALWFRLCPQSWGPDSNPMQIIYAFFKLYCWNWCCHCYCNEKWTIISKKEAGIGPFKNDNLQNWVAEVGLTNQRHNMKLQQFYKKFYNSDPPLPYFRPLPTWKSPFDWTDIKPVFWLSELLFFHSIWFSWFSSSSSSSSSSSWSNVWKNN